MTAPIIETKATDDWRTRRICDTTVAHLFDEDDDGSYPFEAEAKRICGNCPVRNLCLNEAMKSREDYGIWGGLNPKERERYRKMWKLQNPQTQAQKVRRRGGVMNTASAEARYDARLAKARAARERLLILPEDYSLRIEKVGTYSRNQFLQVIDMVIANPTLDAASLAARVNRSQTWLNGILNGIFKEFKVSA
ncbi:transcriptional regulator WhiB-like [Mycobacterium phage Kumao]|uniref:WhiB family transcription factor n=1 Tax=Mycobacterium phage Kumao TaxID=2041344 RepID=A0A2D1GQ18_9CAUD|nr:transcriptional regulator WhiB-like [Mycobacterium phage Kumao]ATN94031.1 WhiB family transcription factor [Mycobacterium phage Kumao]